MGYAVIIPFKTKEASERCADDIFYCTSIAKRVDRNTWVRENDE